jgi:hypothetical protein
MVFSANSKVFPQQASMCGDYGKLLKEFKLNTALLAVSLCVFKVARDN